MSNFINFIDEDEQKCFELLTELDQAHLYANVNNFTDLERKQFYQQVKKLNENYPGGLSEYIKRSKQFCYDSLNNVNPYEGYKPSVPKGQNINFENSQEMDELEEVGLKELKDACFVLVAGGLGERLGYDGIKVKIPVDLLTQTSFLQYYVEYILAIQDKSGASTIPLAIMVSDDTHDLTVSFLKENNNFGMKEGQIIIMKQEKVPAILDNDAKFAQVKDSLLIDTKPHGHGDVHVLLYLTGLVSKWHKTGKKWIIFFQDTNPLVFRSYPAVLGVSKKYNLEVNSLAIPRKPGEAVGAICKLSHENGKNLTINVEYNQLESLFKENGGEPVDSNGYALYPGNINSLVFAVPEYDQVLQNKQGLITEFINPKYTDSTKTKFKSASRLECMMQDYPKLLDNGDRVGFTQIDRKFCFTTCKNDLKTAAQKQKDNLFPECAGSCEEDFYKTNCEILRLAGVQVDKNSQKYEFETLQYEFGPFITLKPSFGITLKEIKSRFQGTNKISNSCGLVLEGSILVKNLEIKNGFLHLSQDSENLSLDDEKNNPQLVKVTQDTPKPYLKIRGYDMKLNQNSQ